MSQDQFLPAIHHSRVEDDVFTLDLARAHIRDLQRDGDEARRSGPRARRLRRPRRFGRR